ncbi:MAG: hypothetical protein IIY35_05795 [Ruminococcus sp.]|nr:hypothetical protein [Ruminococcus sp.]
MKKTIIAISLLAALALTSCGSSTSSSEKAVQTTAASSEASSTSAATTSTAAQTEHETAPQNTVGYEGMNAVSGDALKDGKYNISVDSSSSMFKIADCILYVDNGSMSADIIIASKSYDALFMGTEEGAGNAPESERITYNSNESGQSVFRVPVEALDKEIQCASLSAKKQEWYGRTLVFRADSLPDEAFAESRYTSAEQLGLADGDYTVEVKLEGGSGRASVQSPAELTVKDGKALAKIAWSSDKYDKMVVQEKEYAPVITDGHSVFEIPVTGFDYNMPVSAETTAMSEPHMIDYTLRFDSSTVKKCG